MPNCPSTDRLLESISIPGEMSRWTLLKMKWHTLHCAPCQKSVERLQNTWKAYFQPQPEVASSLLKVYSRLQRDETLILKGWKLDDFLSRRPSQTRLFFRAWGFPTGIAVAVCLFTVVLSPVFQAEPDASDLAAIKEPQVPLSPIRVRDRNSVKVHYVQPELLHSMEFETVSTP
jgi:hypothetical protein